MQYQPSPGAGADLDDTLDIAELRAGQSIDTAAPTADRVRRYTMENSKGAALAGSMQVQRSFAGGLSTLVTLLALTILAFATTQVLTWAVIGVSIWPVIISAGLLGLAVSMTLSLRTGGTALYTRVHASFFATMVLTLAGWGTYEGIALLAPFLICYGVGTMLALLLGASLSRIRSP
jgi:hypothetical protein